ncbi:TIGR03619 family F420-dependent LLM class oxidoreductase [Cryptosporangium aurantiacum]|uniref:Probable F420-dependent oxidoreductase, Rv2161c family n=1 Tax=Cryptosporangium aurantiacum TaxID=134849 RepID=A0A1M7RLV8_9ACTN|nr:TIGR03619 family F420-dependent LLM class oxidoreductase [Cryptosporangium aurantiacum]SHN47303.1 probable F420-dependent oxidoreductase, Rv2161c family [Cryptosporangium aurantiacum]
MSVRIGAKLANFGPDATALAEAAVGLEAAGVDSLWLSDRIVTVDPLASTYPFTADGRVPWTDRTPFVDVLIGMAVAAAHTRRVEIGTGVLVAPLRHPVILAKQLASIDVLSGGRVVAGIGSGWMAEEFDLLGVAYAERASRTDEAVDVLRACWSGDVPPLDGPHHRLPEGVSCYPAPARRIPLLAGGMSPAALRRAGRLDGWFGYVIVDDLDVSVVEAALRTVRSADGTGGGGADGDGADGGGTGGGGTGGDRRDVLRVVGSPAATADALPALVRAGVTEVVTDLDWRRPEQAAADVAMLRAAADAAMAGRPTPAPAGQQPTPAPAGLPTSAVAR